MTSPGIYVSSVPRLPDLFGSVGKPAFVRNVLRSAHELFGSDHVGVMVKGPEGRLHGCVGRSVYGQQRVAIAETNFLARIWSRDPALFDRGSGQNLSQGGVRVTRRWWTDIDDLEYRELCYKNVGTIDRLSLRQNDDEGTVTLNFYRDRKSGPFSNEAGPLLAGVGLIYLAAVSRHLELSDAGGALDPAPAHRDGRWGPCKLSAREFEISERICLGMTSEGIALDLSLSRNTVLTYRKRIYGKLGISSQRELLAMRYIRES